MPIRLRDVLKKMNVGLNTAVEFLHRKGFTEIEANPNVRLNDDQYALLVKEFGKDMPGGLSKYPQAPKSHKKDEPSDSKKEAEPAVIKTEIPEEFRPRIVTKGKDNVVNKTVENYLCKQLDFNKTQVVDWAIGAAMFLSREMFAELGGFDLDYFLYMEDEDICLRIWKMNRPVIYYPDAVMIHNHLRGSSKFSKKTLLHLSSIKTFFQKHGLHIKSYKESFDGIL